LYTVDRLMPWASAAVAADQPSTDTRVTSLPTSGVETGLRMGHESLLTVRCFNTPNRDRRLSFVNNVSADYS